MSVSYVIVMPWIYKKYRDACVATMAPELREHLLEVDNTERNRGVMRSHNMGVAKMRAEGADWLIILSAAVRFGQPEGGRDFIQALEDHPDYYVAHAGSSNSPVVPDIKKSSHQEDPALQSKVFGWHLTAFRSHVFDDIGLFDEVLYPYGWDDIDLSIRLQHYYKGKPGWGVFPVNVSDTTMAHSLALAGVKVDAQPQIDYMVKKWGRHPSDYQKSSYEHPFDDSTLPLSFWPKPPDPRAINHEGWKLNGY